MKKLKYQW